MATPHLWHPGTNRLRGLWTLSTPLLPDEIASSWLVRLAFRQGCEVLTLTGNLWPKWRCWTQDLDRGVSDERVATLSLESGIPGDAFRAATLGSVIGRIADTDSRAQGRWPWTMTLGSRNRLRHGGLQFCPACLADDTAPYYRLHWRLAWHSACDRHALLLLDRCPACRAPLEPHRIDVRDDSLALCASCRHDLRLASATAADAGGLAFQRAADAAVRDGRARAFEREVTASEWFALAAFFATFLRRSNYPSGGSVRRVLAALEIPSPEIDRADRGLEIESMRTATRHALFAILGRVLAIDRGVLVAALVESGITRQALCPKGQSLPNVLEDIGRAMPERVVTARRTRAAEEAVPGPRSREAVETMMATLERRLAKRTR